MVTTTLDQRYSDPDAMAVEWHRAEDRPRTDELTRPDPERKVRREWHFDVADGAFRHDAGSAHLFEMVPSAAFGLGRVRTAKAGGSSMGNDALPLTRPAGPSEIVNSYRHL